MKSKSSAILSFEDQKITIRTSQNFSFLLILYLLFSVGFLVLGCFLFYLIGSKGIFAFAFCSVLTFYLFRSFDWNYFGKEELQFTSKGIVYKAIFKYTHTTTHYLETFGETHSYDFSFSQVGYVENDLWIINFHCFKGNFETKIKLSESQINEIEAFLDKMNEQFSLISNSRSISEE